jgi:hypothetical protein
MTTLEKLEDSVLNVNALKEEVGGAYALARYGIAPEEATVFALGVAQHPASFLFGLLVGADYMEKLAKEDS